MGEGAGSPTSSASLEPFTTADRAALVEAMNVAGYAVIPDALSPDAIAAAQQFVRTELVTTHGEFFSVVGGDAVRGTVLHELGESESFRELLADLASAALGRPIAPERPYQVLRIVASETGIAPYHHFHFDAYAVTAAVPLLIPDEPGIPCGDFVLYPNIRGPRRTIVRNLAEKAVVQNRRSGRVLGSSRARRLLRARTLKLEPGNVYLFWGYRSLHGNDPCMSGRVRATGLFHVGNPHEGSAITRRIQSSRVRRTEVERKLMEG